MEAQRIERRMRWALKEVIRSIDEGRDIDVAKIARRVGLSRSRFRHLFRTQFGISYGRFVRKKKLQRGAMLLRTTHLGVAEISYLLGWESPSHFSRLFRATYGCSPREYRRGYDRVQVWENGYPRQG